MASKLLTLRASHTEHVLVPFLTDMYSIWMPPFSLGCNHVQTEFCSFPSHTAKKLNGISPDLSAGREYLQPSGHNLLTRTLEAKEIKLCEDQKSHWFQLLPLLAKKKKKKVEHKCSNPIPAQKDRRFNPAPVRALPWVCPPIDNPLLWADLQTWHTDNIVQS